MYPNFVSTFNIFKCLKLKSIIFMLLAPSRRCDCASGPQSQNALNFSDTQSWETKMSCQRRSFASLVTNGILLICQCPENTQRFDRSEGGHFTLLVPSWPIRFTFAKREHFLSLLQTAARGYARAQARTTLRSYFVRSLTYVCPQKSSSLVLKEETSILLTKGFDFTLLLSC